MSLKQLHIPEYLRSAPTTPCIWSLTYTQQFIVYNEAPPILHIYEDVVYFPIIES